MLSDNAIVKIAIETESAEPGRDGYILPITFARAIEAASTQDVRAVLVQAVEAVVALTMLAHSLRSAIQGAGSGDSSTLVGEGTPPDRSSHA